MSRSPVQPLLLDFQNVTVPRGNRYVLRRFNLQLRQGEHVALLGPNGSGKSTLIKTITHELHPLADAPSFRWEVLGKGCWDVTELRDHFGIVALDLLQHLSHEVTLREVTAEDMVLSGYFNSLGLWPHHRVTAAQRRHARSLLRLLDIAHLTRRPLSAMSSGEQRRTLIGRALVHRPDALILDEPTNSLDPGAAREFREVIGQLARSGKSLLLVTHHVADIIPEIERVILFKDGQVVADGPKQRLLTSARLSRLFGTRLRVHRVGANYELGADGPSRRRRRPPG